MHTAESMSKLSAMIVIFPVITYQVSGHFTSTHATHRDISFNGTSANQYYRDHLECEANSDCRIDCSHYKNVCRESTIRCPDHGNCDIHCHSGSQNDVCRDITIECPHDGECSLSCHGESACADAHIDARHASHLSLFCGTGPLQQTCAGLTVYFPPNSNGSANAVVSAGDSLNGHNEDLQFYAVNGWNDVEIVDYTGSFGKDHRGQMHCWKDYSQFCDFHPSNWSCAHSTDYCNFDLGMNNVNVLVPTATEGNLAAWEDEAPDTDRSSLVFVCCDGTDQID